MSQQGYTESDRLSADILRKSNKPLLEKKRRARINKSLDQLKGLVLEALKKDSARYSKLEKADILEMTVKHLREMQRQQMAVAVSVDPSVLPKYRAGFNECADEVKRYLSTIDGLSAEMRMRLMNHLANCVTHVNSPPPSYSPSVNMAYQQLPVGTTLGSLPGYPYHPQVAYPELLSAELLARSTMAQSPTECSSPELSPSENHTFNQDYHGAVSPHVTSPPLTEMRAISRGPLSAIFQHQAQTRVIRPLSEQNNNTIYRPNSNVKGTEKISEMSYKVAVADSGLTDAAPGRDRSHVPVHLPLHVDVKQEPVWRPW